MWMWNVELKGKMCLEHRDILSDFQRRKYWMLWVRRGLISWKDISEYELLGRQGQTTLYQQCVNNEFVSDKVSFLFLIIGRMSRDVLWEHLDTTNHPQYWTWIDHRPINILNYDPNIISERRKLSGLWLHFEINV
jgi:hypothetical protein